MNRSLPHQLGFEENAFFRASQWLFRQGFHWVLRWRCGLRFVHAERVRELQQCILAPTHASHLDFWAVLDGILPPLVKKTYVAAAADYFYSPSWRRLLMRLISYHNFPFTRQQVCPVEYQRIFKLLQDGYSLLMFPQGSRARDNGLAEFKALPAMLAVEAKVPVVPVVIRGTFEALPAGHWWPKAHPISIYFGEPLYPEEVLQGQQTRPVHKQAHLINQALMQRIRALWVESEAGLPAIGGK